MQTDGHRRRPAGVHVHRQDTDAPTDAPAVASASAFASAFTAAFTCTDAFTCTATGAGLEAADIHIRRQFTDRPRTFIDAFTQKTCACADGTGAGLEAADELRVLGGVDRLHRHPHDRRRLDMI